MIVRNSCVICGAADLSELLNVPDYPVFQGCVTAPRGSDECAPMTWWQCGGCGSAQISPLPPLDHIYQAGHATGLGAAWKRHHAAFANFLIAHARDGIVDVGGGSGTLAIAYRNAGGGDRFTILEPNALRAADLPDDITVMDGFLEAPSLAQTGAATIVMCHMFEHATDLRAALTAINAALPDNGRICLAWPELEHWTAKGVAGALNFEHGIYVTVPRLLTLLAEFGWRERARERWKENDTLFLALDRGGAAVEVARSDADHAVPEYFLRLRRQASAAQQAAASHPGDVFLMPASVYSQSLLAMGLDEQRLTGLIDNAAAKQHRRLYGTKLTVFPAAALLSANDPLVILNAGAHNGEIAEGLRTLRPDIRLVDNL
ncbi:MAG TPA: methyltransferase domain-containing protein [Rhizomicrobium sp.]|nr:methyltransferase domain-containing protein [Rhizomicrobium sp.]